VTENGATLGNVTSASITSGYLSPSTTRVNHGIDLLCAISDPTTSGIVGGTQRIFGSSEDGSIWYTDTANDNYSLGFYSLLYWNPTYKIATFAPTTSTIKMAIDGGGNVYAADGLVIKKFVKSLDYSQQTFYTLVAGADFTQSNYLSANHVLDIQIDSSDNLHLLIGSSGQSALYSPVTGYLTHTIISSSAARTKTELLHTISDTGGSSGYPKITGFDYGGLVLDYTNPASNFTYGYTHNDHGTITNYLYHNSSSGTYDIAGGALTTFTSIADIEYNNYQIYVAGNPDLIRSYITTFAGQLPGQVGGGTPAELTYSTSTINILEASYYNNTPIDVNVNVVVDLSGQSLAEDLLNIQNNYRWKMQLNDPNGAQIAFHLSGTCIEVGFSCSMNETLSISPPLTNWTSGTYTAYLKEYNIDTYTEHTLATDTTAVLNQSGNNSGVTITEPITSGTGTTALSIIDNLTGLLGFGVNPISKFIFAMILITVFMFFGYIATKYDTMGGIITASLPFCFFVFVSYIPLWTVIIVVLIIAFKGRWVG